MAEFEDLEVVLRWAEGAEVPALEAVLQRLQGPEKAMAERLLALGQRRRAFARQLGHTAKLAEMGLALAGIVHDMRQPLSAISGFAQLWTEHPADPAAKTWVGEIRGQASRLEQMVERLRRFARRGEEPAAATRADAAEAAREAVALFPKLPPGIQLSLDVSRSPCPEALADHGALQQVLFNLLSNARDAFEGREQGAIAVRVEPLEAGVRILVADDGAGIPPEVRSRLFEPFATSKGEAGTGLGLYLCRQLLLPQGGAVQCLDPAPAPFRTAFAVDLKAAPAEVESAAAVARDPSGAAARQLVEEMRAAVAAARPARRALVADEQPAMRRALRVLLADEPGLQVLEAGDAASAAAALGGAPAVLVLEKTLGSGVSGLELLRLARSRDVGAEAIVVTGQPSLQSALDALELGAADYLVKPLEPVDQLRGRVRELLARQRRRLLLRSLDSMARVWAERALAVRSDRFARGSLRSALERLAARPEGPGLFLVLDDAPAAQEVALAGHRAQGRIDWAGAPAALLESRCDAVVIGASLPVEAALDLIARARSLPWPVHALWSGPIPRFDWAVQAIRAGGGGLALRPADRKGLGALLTALVRAHREETRALALGRALEELEIGLE